jgi:hypothetical protein
LSDEVSSPAYVYLTGIIRTNLREQNAVRMLLDRLPPEFASKIEEDRPAQEAKARADAEAKAKAEAEAKARAEAEAQRQRDIAAFFAKSPLKQFRPMN